MCTHAHMHAHVHAHTSPCMRSQDVVRDYTKRLSMRMSRRRGASARMHPVPSLSRVAKESLTRELMSNEMDNLGLMVKLRERMEA